MKNMYAFDRNKQKWISLNTTKLSFDPPSWGYDTAGTHEFDLLQIIFMVVLDCLLMIKKFMMTILLLIKKEQ